MDKMTRRFTDRQGNETIPTGQREFSRVNNQFIRFKRTHMMGYFVTALEKYRVEIRETKGNITDYDSFFFQLLAGWKASGNRAQATITDTKDLLNARESTGRFLAREQYHEEAEHFSLTEGEFDLLIRFVDREVVEWQTYMEGISLEIDKAVNELDAYETLMYGLMDAYTRPVVDETYENYRVTNDFIVAMHLLYHLTRFFDEGEKYNWRDIRWYRETRIKLIRSYALDDEIKVSSKRLAKWLALKEGMTNSYREAFDR